MSTNSGDSPNPLAKLPIINRVKAVKDLALSRLDNLDYKVDGLLANDTLLLKGVIDLTEAVHSLTTEIQSIGQQVEATQQEIKLIEQIQAQEISKQKETGSNIGASAFLGGMLPTGNEALNRNLPKVLELPSSDPETRLMAYLYSYLPNRRAIDIGANIGDVSEKLLEVGYEVYAFEPFPEVFERLKNRFLENKKFHSYPMAIGSSDETREFYLAQDQTEENIYRDSALYNSLTKHSMPEDIVFTNSISVPVRSISSLHDAGDLPGGIDLVKIDTEGFDLEVLRGMGLYRYAVVVAEFWDAQFPFGLSEAYNRLEDMVSEMRTKGYNWNLVIYRVWGSDEVSFYCNYPQSIEKSWGNVFFFQDYKVFTAAFKWCSNVLSETYLT